MRPFRAVKRKELKAGRVIRKFMLGAERNHKGSLKRHIAIVKLRTTASTTITNFIRRAKKMQTRNKAAGVVKRFMKNAERNTDGGVSTLLSRHITSCRDRNKPVAALVIKRFMMNAKRNGYVFWHERVAMKKASEKRLMMAREEKAIKRAQNASCQTPTKTRVIARVAITCAMITVPHGSYPAAYDLPYEDEEE